MASRLQGAARGVQARTACTAFCCTARPVSPFARSLLPPNTAMSSLAGALDLPPSTRPSDDIDMHSEDDDDLFGNKSVQPPFLSMLYSQRTPARHPRLLLAPVRTQSVSPPPSASAARHSSTRRTTRPPRSPSRSRRQRSSSPTSPSQNPRTAMCVPHPCVYLPHLISLIELGHPHAQLRKS